MLKDGYLDEGRGLDILTAFIETIFINKTGYNDYYKVRLLVII